MIVVKIIGGLGNQLFQYAAGRALAERYGVKLRLDINPFSSYDLHDYSLDAFNIPQRLVSKRRVRRLCKQKLTIAEEKDFPKLLEMGDRIYLSGFWQRQRYFSSIEPILRRELSLKKPPKAMGGQGVSLHIRRGDYVSDPRTLAIHGLCPLSYYATCAKEIAEEIESPHFFVFSDDPDWVEANLKLPYPMTTVPRGKSYEDLHRMSQCQHHIIANSTFSWWGAWLNPSKEKIVYAPREWCASGDIADRFPKEWKLR